MMIRLCFLHKEEWRCPSQIQSWPLCFPGPPKESDCTGDIFLLPKARVWMIGSRGRRPIAGNHRRSACSSIQIKLRWALFVTYTIIQSIMWNVFSAFNPSKWSSGQPTSSWGFGALLKGLTSVSSPTLYPLGHDCPVPFFPEVHEEVTRSRKAPRCFNGQGHRPARHGPPSGPPGQAIKQLHEGGADPGVLQELLTATDLALRVTKVKAWSLGQTMSTLVVQECHLWLTLADMREAGKHHFLDSHISQAGLFGEAVESFAQQFSNAQKQMEAFHHILSWWSAAVSTPPQSLRLLSSAEGALLLPPPPLQLGLSSSLHTGQSVELMAGKRGSPSPPLPSKWRSFCFLFVLFRRWLPSQWYSKTQKIVSFFSWSQ